MERTYFIFKPNTFILFLAVIFSRIYWITGIKTKYEKKNKIDCEREQRLVKARKKSKQVQFKRNHHHFRCNKKRRSILPVGLLSNITNCVFYHIISRKATQSFLALLFPCVCVSNIYDRFTIRSEEGKKILFQDRWSWIK